MAEAYANKTWQELGMKPGIKVPGTTSWMARWRKEPNQKWMIEYAQVVEILFQVMTDKQVDGHIKLYLTGEWDLKDEAKIAAAIRRTPIIESKYNLMEVGRMSKKDKKTVVKKAEAEEKGSSLKERIEALEEQVKHLIKDLGETDEELNRLKELQGPAPEKKKEKKAEAETAPATADVKKLLKELEKAKEDGDKKEAFKLRVKLRKAGYSLRANGKK